ncbi:MAG: Mth938-like domain-containing protein [Gammaproteobacteria bacterium]|nr:Mth938-like domain-containing protein [Gammaproteobacteria bacterium]
MKFAQDSQDEGYVITAYDNDSISINGKPFNNSLVVATTQLNENWNLNSIELLQTRHIDLVLSFKPELIIIGTGNKLVFPAVELYSAIIAQGIGVDFMDTRAACRTYNILMSEGRGIVAGLIL